MTVKFPLPHLYSAALLLCVTVPVFAQPVFVSPPPPAKPPATVIFSSDPNDLLAVNLKILAQNPYDVTALTEAGLGALAGGDPSAAIGFLARAEELNPRSGKIKAALGSALVQIEKPTEALRLFAEATAFGSAERDIAGDRGLAYDLLGQNKLAQKDYATTLRYKQDSETTRRYALSLGIAGNKKEALDLLTPLLEREDQGAWRARAFILAMNGEVEEGDRIARAVTPLALQGTMTPFLRRLGTLGLANRAAAVHFGTMPADGARYAMVDPGDSFRSVGNGTSDGLTPKKEEPPQRVVAAPVPEESPREERKRLKRDRELMALAAQDRKIAVTDAVPVAAPVMARPVLVKSEVAPQPSVSDQGPLGRRVGARISAVDPMRLPPELRPALVQPDGTKLPPVVSTVTLVPTMTSLPPPSAAPLVVNAPPSAAPLVVNAPPQPVVETVVVAANPVPGFTLTPAVTPAASSAIVPTITEPEPVVAPVAPVVVAAVPEPLALPLTPPVVPPSVAPPPATPEPMGLAAILASIVPETESVAAALPSDTEIKAMRLAARRKQETDSKAKAAAEAEVAKKAEAIAIAKRAPARIWVQIATGANRAGLPGTWKKLQGQAGKTLAGQSAASVGYKATNRLLIGPFKSTAEARAMVSKLSKDGIQATSFTSDAGQEIAKIGGK